MRHPHLTVLNSLPICKGLITRTRTLITGKVEKSVLDFFVVCSLVLTHITEMLVDEERNYAITNYTQIPKGGKAVDSDHMTTLAKIQLNIVPHKMQTESVYNLKNIICKKPFKSNTSSTRDFTESINNHNSVQFKCDEWNRVLDSHIKQAFNKLKVRKSKIKPCEVDSLIKKRNKLKKNQET